MLNPGPGPGLISSRKTMATMTTISTCQSGPSHPGPQAVLDARHNRTSSPVSKIGILSTTNLAIPNSSPGALADVDLILTLTDVLVVCSRYSDYHVVHLQHCHFIRVLNG